MTDRNSVLQGCPFCGDSALLQGLGEHNVICTNCNVLTPDFATADEAIAAWNRRTPVEPVLPSEASTSSPSPQEQGMRNMLDRPYSADERRVAAYIAGLTGMGGSDDPIGFLIASHAALSSVGRGGGGK